MTCMTMSVACTPLTAAINVHRNDLEVLRTIRKSSVQCCKQHSLCFLQASMDDYICNDKENA